MLDGSELPYEENVRLTKEVTDLAHMVGVSVEGEIGTIGVMSNSDEGGVENVTYTNPEEDVYKRQRFSFRYVEFSDSIALVV